MLGSILAMIILCWSLGYVYGSQTVLIPKVKLSAWLRPEVSQALWGN